HGRGTGPGKIFAAHSHKSSPTRIIFTFSYFYPMRKMTLTILVLSFFGCKNFETEKLSQEEVLRQKMEHFNWKEVDTYPSFDSCDGIFEKAAAKKCFETTLAQYFLASFSKQQLVATDSVNAMTYVYLGISNKGKASIDSIKIPS